MGLTAGTQRGRTIAKLTLAMVLASVVPLVVAAYGLYGSPAPFDVDSGNDLTWSVVLLAAAIACAAAGAIMLWRLMTSIRATGTPLSLSGPLEAGAAATTEPRPQPR